MARLYTDEDFSCLTAEKLRQLGHDVLTCRQSGRAGRGIKDEDVLAYAIADKRAVITINRKDYRRFHKRDPNHYGIIICTKNDDVNELALRIHETLGKFPKLAGELVRVYRPG